MKLQDSYIAYYARVNGELLGNNRLPVKLMNTDDPKFIPTKKYLSDAGYDCRARIDEPIRIKPLGRAKIPLGFGINIPLNYTGDLRPRSGLQAEHGIVVGYGTIDAGYTGEVEATIFNLGEEEFTIHPGDRIAQLVIVPIVQQNSGANVVDLHLVNELVELDRGEKGFGSSGVK